VEIQQNLSPGRGSQLHRRMQCWTILCILTGGPESKGKSSDQIRNTHYTRLVWGMKTLSLWLWLSAAATITVQYDNGRYEACMPRMFDQGGQIGNRLCIVIGSHAGNGRRADSYSWLCITHRSRLKADLKETVFSLSGISLQLKGRHKSPRPTERPNVNSDEICNMHQMTTTFDRSGHRRQALSRQIPFLHASWSGETRGQQRRGDR
jgi:hypothetical protein